jgi:O-antigen ligase
MKTLRDFPMWITDKYIFLMLLVYPLFLWYKGYVNLTVSKFAFFAGLTGLWLIALIIGIVKARIRVRRLSAAQWCTVLYLLVCIVSAAASPYFFSAIIGAGRYDGLMTSFLCIAVFFGVSAFARPKKSYVAALAVSMALCCVIAVLQLFGYNPLGLYPGSYNYYDGGYEYSGEFLGTIGNADLFSAYLCLCVPLFAGYYIAGKMRTVWLLPVIALGVFCAFACKVSAGKLAMGLSLIVMLPIAVSDAFRLRRALEAGAAVCTGLFFAFGFVGGSHTDPSGFSFEFSKLCLACAAGAVVCIGLRLALGRAVISSRTLRTTIVALEAAAVACGFYIVYNWSGTEGTVYELSRVLHGEISDDFGSKRILIWRETLELVRQRPLLGGGPGTLALRLDVDFERFVAETGKTLSGSVDNAHNVYLGVLANTGVISLVFYVAALVAAWFSALRKPSPVASGIAAALACYLIQDFFGLGLSIVSALMFIIAGLAVSRRKELCKQ